jgi:hypothetical protein
MNAWIRNVNAYFYILTKRICELYYGIMKKQNLVAEETYLLNLVLNA